MTYMVHDQALTSGVSETEIDNDGGNNYSNNRNYLLTYYVKVSTAATLGLGTMTVIFRWNDGTQNRTFTSSTILLTSLNVLNGSLVIKTSDQNPIPRPTYEIILTSLLGGPVYEYMINLDLQNS